MTTSTILTEDGPYQDRCVLFMDILGFRALIDAGEQDKIWRILNKANQLARNPPEEAAGVEITSFSDSIVISAPMQRLYAIDTVCGMATQLVLEFIDETILTRGAITVGKLHHSGSIVFGPALNSAYDYESRLANYPRIVVSDEAINTARKESEILYQHLDPNRAWEIKQTGGLFRKDFDGLYHLEIFSPLFNQTYERLIASKKRTNDDYTKAIREIMRKKPQPEIGEVPSVNMLNIMAKYDWLQAYFVSAMQRNEEFFEMMCSSEDKDPRA